MTAPDALARVIQPPPLTDLGLPFATREAECMLLAIGLQESGFRLRRQRGGPARGFWQFEPGPMGGVQRFLHEKVDPRIREEVVRLGWPLEHDALYRGLAIGEGDHMACLLARGLLWPYRHPLPALGDEQHAFDQYIAVWRPAPKNLTANRRRWARGYPQALAAVRAPDVPPADAI